MNVCIFAPDLYHAMETIAFYFRTNGAKVTIATQTGDAGSEHPWSLERVRRSEIVCSISDEPAAFDLMIADAFVDLRYLKALSGLASRTKHLAFLFPHDGTTIKRRAGHLLRYWPQSVKAKTSIFIGDRRLTADTMAPAFQGRAFYSPYIHPQLLTEETLHQVFADFTMEGKRPYSIGFIGNKNPPERGQILRECRQVIDKNNTRSMWIEYGDDEHHTALAPHQYIEALGQMDFCICPAGWGGNWTHRVIESLCRGAIPILPDHHLYGLDLRDSFTCLTVRGGDWHGVISNALHLPIESVREMRRNILNLRDTLLVPQAAASRFSRQFY